MLSVYCLSSQGLKPLKRENEAPLPEEAVWLDLLEPTSRKRLWKRDSSRHSTREESRDES